MFRYHVHDRAGELVAGINSEQDAAMVADGYGPGATVRLPRGDILWHEGQEMRAASDGYPYVESVIRERACGAVRRLS